MSHVSSFITQSSKFWFRERAQRQEMEHTVGCKRWEFVIETQSKGDKLDRVEKKRPGGTHLTHHLEKTAHSPGRTGLEKDGWNTVIALLPFQKIPHSQSVTEAGSIPRSVRSCSPPKTAIHRAFTCLRRSWFCVRVSWNFRRGRGQSGGRQLLGQKDGRVLP